MNTTKLFLSAALLAVAAPVAAQQVETRTVGTATLENVPAIPADIAEAVQRYQNSRSAEFQVWQPDGSMLITTRFGSTDQVHHVRAPGAARTQVSFYAEPVAGAHAIPGSDRFIVRRDTGGDEWFQLYVRGLTGTEQRLTEPETRNSPPVLSDDGHLAVWAKAVRGTARYELQAADPLAPEAARTLYTVEGSIDPSDISEDGSTLLFVRSFSNRQSEVWELDIASGEARRLTEAGAEARYDEPHYIRGGRILTISDHGGDYRRLLELDPATGEERAITPDIEWNVEAFDASKDGRVLAYAVNEGGYSRVAVQDFLTRRALPQPEGLPKGVLTGLKWSPDGSKLAIGLTGPTAAGDVYSFSVPQGELTRWTNSELGGLGPEEISEPELIRFETFDGREIPAFVYRPAGIPEGQKTPVIMDIHGGPESQTRPVWNYGAQFFANALGATVILPNVRGSDGYGRTYLDLDNAEKREDSVRDIGALIDWIETQPNLDAERIAVYGQSYGGYMSLAVMTHYSDRLVGGVERYGISNFITFLENTEDYRRANRRGEYGDETDPEMRAVFERIAPMNNLQKISKPMLVMQGANDPRVPQSESDQVVAALRQNDVDTWYVLFADEGHGFHKKANNDLRREVEAVFLRDLFGETESN
ncbi:S9 family peptidase [Pacificimonas flava]|uniref:Peptidase S9, prolyl oligopeptidase active site domain protein n=1 Tax=Pacificimonas flava TaxID=1234595 RepID=M2U2C1_9SPHN|nr:alpha/beta fold hydrolase [Pacificimonas flava]EMD81958.1 peptidase S9, prolyl oligopeptidase active site domain protein [Pacificimonas flava]MBB5280478.1 protease II [Pacificimonas flava]